MNILHYTIGLPPIRHGGSVQVAHDLIKEQIRSGHNVLALTCGETLLRGKISRIRKIKNSDIGFPVFQLTNPLTPTLIYGCSDPLSQFREIKINRKNIEDFIENYEIQILHIHTMMGLHKDIVRIFKEKNVRIIYTTHDFHGICPHYNLIKYNGELCGGDGGRKECYKCNAHEPSDYFLRLVNSRVFHSIKKVGVLSLLKPLNKNIRSTQLTYSQNIDEEKDKAFNELLNYYNEYFRYIDYFHFNSTQTRLKFEEFLGPLKGKVIPVVTSEVRDFRRSLIIKDMISFGFIGNLMDYKGFPMLREVVSELSREGFGNFKIKVYGSGMEGICEDCPAIEFCPSYSRDEISTILYQLNGVIVPSKWFETFSLVTLEALAHGRPVIVSDHVGAKDIVANFTPEFIFSSKEELKNIIKKCVSNPGLLQKANERILADKWPYGINQMSKDITNLYSLKF